MPLLGLYSMEGVTLMLHKSCTRLPSAAVLEIKMHWKPKWSSIADQLQKLQCGHTIESCAAVTKSGIPSLCPDGRGSKT